MKKITFILTIVNFVILLLLSIYHLVLLFKGLEVYNFLYETFKKIEPLLNQF